MRLSFHNRFCEINFEDLLDCHRILYYNKDFEELIFEVVVKSSKTLKFIILEILPLYGICVYACLFVHLCVCVYVCLCALCLCVFVHCVCVCVCMYG